MNAVEDVASLTIRIPPLAPGQPIDDVAKLFLNEEYTRFLSLPVVEADGSPVGVVSRYDLMKVYLKMYGREVYGKQPVSQLMNPEPLVVIHGQTLEEASQYLTAHIRSPVTEDFIVIQDGEYQGVGIVLDMLRAMQKRLGQRSWELAKAYRNLKSSQAQLVQSEKMASLGQMVAGVAHEINTPLGYVRSNLESAQDFFGQLRDLFELYETLVATLTSEEPDPGELEEQLQLAGEMSEALREVELFDSVAEVFKDSLYGVDQIAELVMSLKNFSRLDQAHTDNVNLNECLDSALVIAKNVIKHKAVVKKQYAELPPLRCSPSQLNQVFLNLFTNAAQAIEGQGVLSIKTWVEPDWIHVSIQDSGKGMTREVMKKIFDPFYTTKPVGEGTGLGLSISYKIVQQHQGRIRVNSEPGKGTRFVISLPREANSVARVAEEQS